MLFRRSKKWAQSSKQEGWVSVRPLRRQIDGPVAAVRVLAAEEFKVGCFLDQAAVFN
jgi:hypothetical protein